MKDLITNIRRKPLPEPFQTWAQLRREESSWPDENELREAFDWSGTPEGHKFWYELNAGLATEPHPSWEPQVPQEPLTMEDVFVGLK